ncbi:hypothetical protein BCR34DRAFT_660780 [Clohesyomyces aquaticus]|uniref:Transcription factor TFIIIB component B'' Myb domain-containing protein n=1 Tax=Clohesyomyces aquaticus TaxID=1231657 RepID=A0A1Y2A569_9PLEO|nr:hypothetical protein BCR34DRAFT_660780 [Clohesyomyces aquaticus]
MTSEAGSSQPPPDSTDKQQTTKPAGGGGSFSAFVNKSGAGRTFKPKAPARRRPAAAPAPRAPAPETPAPPAPQAGQTPDQTQPSSEPAAESQIVPGPALPTPSATQEPVHEDAAPSEQSSSVPPPTAPEPAVSVSARETTTRARPEPSHSLGKDGSAGGEIAAPRLLSVEEDAARDKTPESRPAEHPSILERNEAVSEAVPPTSMSTQESPAGHASTSPVPTSTEPSPEATATVAPPAIQDEQPALLTDTPEISETTSPAIEQPTETSVPIPTHVENATTPPAPVPRTGEPSIDTTGAAVDVPTPDATQVAETSSSTEQPPTRRKRRVLPWQSVNKPQTRPATFRPFANSRRKRQTDEADPAATDGQGVEDDEAAAEEDMDEDDEGDEETFEPPAKAKAPTTKVRGKRKAASANVADSGEGQPAKKTRKVRKDKGTKKKKQKGTSAEAQNEEQAADEDGTPSRKTATKKRKRAARDTTEGSQEEEAQVDENGNLLPRKRKGRLRVRAPTPSDAEDQEIEPSGTFMDELATRNIKVGKLSEREKKMRQINWQEVAERRRDEGQRELMMRSKDQPQNEAAAEEEAGGGLQMHVIDGEIRYVQGTGVIDREGDAEREREGYRMVEDDDLTRRVNNRSWLFRDKRFPEDYLAIAQGRPFHWNADSTALFYNALEMFGTDFKMISTLFPGATRKSIKRKFTKEERENPEDVKAALRRQGQPADAAGRKEDWDKYLQMTGKTEDSFLDVQAVYAELEQEARAMQVEIDAAKAKHEEERRQKRLAGVELSEDEAQVGNAKENARKKKRKGKQPVAFDDEEGVEIVGSIDD